MIVGLKHAILHILDANSGVTVFSDDELDLSDAMVDSFITKHIDKVCADSGARRGEFNESSGFLYHVKEYIASPEEERDLHSLSMFIAERLYEGISHAENTESCDVLICDCNINERPAIAVLKFDNKVGYTHRVLKEDGEVRNEIINHYAILPSASTAVREYAFIDQTDLTIRFKGQKRSIDGEKVDLMADLLLECSFDISSRESINAVNRIAKKVTEVNEGDSIDTSARMKRYVVESVEKEDLKFVEPQKIADTVFEGRPVMKAEFLEEVRKAQVPEKVEVTGYVTKKMSSNIKLSTDIGVDLSFPAEYYSNSDYIEIINNDDGTISIKINNIGELKNK
ncbi:MAG: nucleoid-associated protein [Clostridiales bacterium]|nr:nucleoid-associated protein [Clostridiales bacterium]